MTAVGVACSVATASAVSTTSEVAVSTASTTSTRTLVEETCKESIVQKRDEPAGEVDDVAMACAEVLSVVALLLFNAHHVANPRELNHGVHVRSECPAGMA
jgi:hypothetical protein